ncbi:MAG: ABC transporter permease [Planctomycetota bacterium]
MNILNLTKRELLAYFLSPLAYVVMTAFLFFSGIFFYSNVTGFKDTSAIRWQLDIIGFISLFALPLITMRLLAEEKKSGTIEMLMTAPVTETAIIISKFLGALIFYLFLIAPTIIYVILLLIWGNLDIGSLLAGYLGLILLVGVFIAIGLFISSFTESQLLAAIVTWVILIIWYIIGGLAGELSNALVSFLNAGVGWLFGSFDAWSSKLTAFFEYIGFFKHLEPFSKGLIDTRGVVFYLSLVVFFLFLTIRVVESKRWK